MRKQVDLSAHLTDWAGDDGQRRGVAQTVEAVAEAGIAIAERVAHRRLEDADAAATPHFEQFNDIILDALKGTPVALFGSRKNELPVTLDGAGTLVVVAEPIDGLADIDTNTAIGTIFSIYPAAAAAEDALLQPGERQLAAGFIVYSGATKLALTVGAGTQIFTLDRQDKCFYLTRPDVQIPASATEYAINASNYRFWDEPVRAYVDDLIAGSEGPRGKDFNMRWIGSLVAELYRILVRGGIYLYPHDDRPGYARGRAHLVYQANAIAFLVEQAGGRATDGVNRLLQVVPDDLHQRIPLIFGSKDKVDRVRRYYEEPSHIAERSPLFGKRSLFRT